MKSAKATCEGAVLFFRHWKTLTKNMARVFIFGLISLAVIGSVFFGLAYLIFSKFPAWFVTLTKEFAETAAKDGTESAGWQWLTDPGSLTLISAAVVGVNFWSILHSVFIKPFVLTGVLRNYIASGINDIPGESSFAELDSKSRKFRKCMRKQYNALHQE